MKLAKSQALGAAPRAARAPLAVRACATPGGGDR